MPILYCLVHHHVFTPELTDRKVLGFYESPTKAEAARFEVAKLPGFKDQPDNFAIEPFRLDDLDEDGPPPETFFPLEFDREIIHRDPAGEILFYEDIEKTLGVYSTAVKAAEALVAWLREPDYADYPTGFWFGGTTLNTTGWETGYLTAWGDEETHS